MQILYDKGVKATIPAPKESRVRSLDNYGRMRNRRYKKVLLEQKVSFVGNPRGG